MCLWVASFLSVVIHKLFRGPTHPDASAVRSAEGQGVRLTHDLGDDLGEADPGVGVAQTQTAGSSQLVDGGPDTRRRDQTNSLRTPNTHVSLEGASSLRLHAHSGEFATGDPTLPCRWHPSMQKPHTGQMR